MLKIISSKIASMDDLPPQPATPNTPEFSVQDDQKQHMLHKNLGRINQEKTTANALLEMVNLYEYHEKWPKATTKEELDKRIRTTNKHKYNRLFQQGWYQSPGGPLDIAWELYQKRNQLPEQKIPLS